MWTKMWITLKKKAKKENLRSVSKSYPELIHIGRG
jgi:hypothetical protein